MQTDSAIDTEKKPVEQERTTSRPEWNSLKAAAEQRNAYLTVIHGSLVGRTYRLGSGRLFLGRAADSDVVLDDDGVSRRHALFVSAADGKIMVEDLGSTNGTLVNGKLCSVQELHGGERLQFGSESVFKFEFRDRLEERYATYLYESATQDHLTGVFNERFMRDHLHAEFAWHSRHAAPLSLIFLDIDHFKSVNDQYGHLAGDEVLKQVALRCHSATRTEDVFARYGGEEFACLLRSTPVDAAAVLAERMRAMVAQDPFEYRGPGRHCSIPITISAGVAHSDAQVCTPEALIEEADRLLYVAKHARRNRVVSAPAGPVSAQA